MPTEALFLPPRMGRLYGALALDTDTPISDLLEALGREKTGLPQDQMRLGSSITRLNRRLKEHRQRVIPGRLKRTYRLVRV